MPDGMPTPPSPEPEVEEVDGPRPLLPTQFGDDFITHDWMGTTSNPLTQGVTGQSGFTQGVTLSRYFENDQGYIWANGSRVTPASMSPEAIANYQRSFVSAGLLSEGSYSPGAWDDASIAANRVLLRTANVNGATAPQMLAALQRGAASRAPSGGGGGRIAPTIRLTNRDDLKAAFRQVARQVSGGIFVEDDQIDGMVDAFHDKERSYQRALARGGGETEAAPSAQTFAETSLGELDEGGAEANRFQAMASAMTQLVGG